MHSQAHVISSMDANGDGMISVDELLAVASKLTLEHIQKLFQLLQPKNEGVIKITDFLVKAQTNVEVQKILANTPSLSMLCNPHTYINELIEMDVNNDGCINVEEMYHFMCKRAYYNHNYMDDMVVGNDGYRTVFLNEMDTRQYIRSIFNLFKPGHHDVVTATTFIRAIKFNLAVRDLLDGHPYLKLLPYARDLEELCKSIDKNNDGLITIDEVLLFARTLQERKRLVFRCKYRHGWKTMPWKQMETSTSNQAVSWGRKKMLLQ